MKKVTLLLLMTILWSFSSFGQDFPDPYCSLSFNTVEPITLVEVAGISNLSDAPLNESPALEDFTDIVGSMEEGETYSVALEGNTGGAYTSNFTVFIDWNQDGILDNDSERYDIGTINGSTGTDGQQAIGDIVVPSGVTSGLTRMRVIKRYGGYAVGSCNVGGTFGQAEDYTIEVSTLSAACEAVTDVDVSDITENGGTVSWTASTTATDGYEVNIFSEGSNPVTDTPIATETVSADVETVDVSGLDADTTYDVYITSDCGDDTAMSTVLTFTTSEAEGTFPSPYCLVTSFTTVEPITLVEVAGISNASNDVANGSPAHEDFTSIIGNMEEGETYSIALEGNTNGPYNASFTVFIDWNQDGELDNHSERYEIGIINTSTGTDGQQAIGDILVPAGVTAGLTRMRVIKQYAGGYANTSCSVDTNYGQAEDYTIDVVANSGGCDPVTGVAVTDITENGATVSWTASTTATDGYEVNVFSEGANPVTDTPTATETVSAGVETVDVEGLDANTTYDVYVTSDCGDDTAMSTVITFTTNEADGTFPDPYCLVTSFNTVEPITLVEVAGISNVSDAAINGSPAHENFTSIVGNMEEGETYTIALEGNTNGSYAASFTVFIDWNQDGELDNDSERYEIGIINTSTGTDGKQAIGDILVPAGVTAGLTRMRVIKKYTAGYANTSCSAGTTFGQAEDYTIEVSTSPAGCDPVTDVTVTDIAENSATVSWTGTSTATGGYIVMGYLEGADPTVAPMEFTQVVGAGVSTVGVTGLEADTSYDVYVLSICGTDSTMSDVITFTTDQTAGVNGNEISNINYFPNPVNDNLTITAAHSIDNITVFNLLGQTVMQAQPRSMNVVLDLSSLPTGTYVLKANAADSVSTFKVVKK